MTMRIASYNVENLFDRAKALSNTTPEAVRKEVLQQHAKINGLLEEPTYTNAIKTEIIELLTKLGLALADDGGAYAILRQSRGRLLRRPAGGGLEIIATGRSDWVGWVELKTEPVDELATRHTAMVMKDIKADVLGVVEADDRIVLRDFSSILLKAVTGKPFDHVMVIDGNDTRGIDCGIMTRKGFDIVRMVSHVDDVDSKGEIFSRDCPEYHLRTKAGNELVVLVNHFKSKGYGSVSSSNAKRRRQAKRTAAIYADLVAAGHPNVAVLGDLNDTPDSDPLKALVQDTDLRDITVHPSFTADPQRPGTYANGTKSNKIDYILLSPSVFATVKGGTIFRKGVWGGVNGTLFPHYPTMTAKVHQASDHAALYADLDL